MTKSKVSPKSLGNLEHRSKMQSKVRSKAWEKTATLVEDAVGVTSCGGCGVGVRGGYGGSGCHQESRP